MISPYYRRLRDAIGHDVMLIPGVAAVIHDDRGRLLLQKKHDGTWSLPAGAIELGESPEVAVRREVLEETGIECLDVQLIGVFGGNAFRYTYPNSDQVEYLIVLFECRGATIQPISETEETRYLEYFTRDDFPGLELPYDIDLLYSSHNKSIRES